MVYLEVTCKGTEDEADYWKFDTVEEAAKFLYIEHPVRFMLTDYPMFDDDRYDYSTERV